RRYKDADVEVGKEIVPPLKGLRHTMWTGYRPSCAASGQPCSPETQCCYAGDTCLTHTDSNYVVSTFCKDIRNQQYLGPRLPKEAPCQDSGQCIDGCCREYRGARVSKVTVCGTPSDSHMPQYTCVSSSPF
ncbi:hypothetical protein Bpfe_003088, partial [Biomphalaria pfeifferi]